MPKGYIILTEAIKDSEGMAAYSHAALSGFEMPRD